MAHCQFNRGAGLRIMKTTKIDGSPVDELLRVCIKKSEEKELRKRVDKSDIELKKQHHARQKRIREISQLVLDAQDNIRRMLGEHNPEFTEYFLRVLKTYSKHRLTRTFEKSPPHCTDTLLFGEWPDSESMVPNTSMEHILYISTETGTPEMKPDIAVKVATITIPQIKSKDVPYMKIEILKATYSSHTGAIEYEPCEIYSSKFIDRALRALAKPEKTINFLVKKFGDGHEVEYCKSN